MIEIESAIDLRRLKESNGSFFRSPCDHDHYSLSLFSLFELLRTTIPYRPSHSSLASPISF